MSDKKFCYRCGAPMQASDAFCMQCGAKVLKKKHTFCYHCGAQLNEGDAFCMKCGTPVKKQAVPPTPPAPPKPKTPGKQPPAGKPAKRKGKAGKIVLRVIAAVLVVVLLAGVWKGGCFVWSLFEKDGSVELQAGQTVQPGQTVTYAETQGKTAPGVDNAKKTIAGTLGIDADNLTNGRKSEALGETFYRFEQTYNGIPVYGRVAILATEGSGETIGMYGNYMELDGVDTTPVLSDEEAQKQLKRKLGETTVLSSELTLFTLEDGEPELAWLYYVSSKKFYGECVVSAENGKILFKNSYDRFERQMAYGVDNVGNERTFYAERHYTDNDIYYRLVDSVRNFKVYDSGESDLERWYYFFDDMERYEIYRWRDTVRVTRESDGAQVKLEDIPDSALLDRYRISLAGFDILPDGSLTKEWTNRNAVAVMSGLNTCYDFYDQYFDLEGFDGHNGTVIAMYNDNMNGDTSNASSSSDLNEYGVTFLKFGSAKTIFMDLIGHEYTHSVENAKSGMLYSGESGAIMEAYSDIFGEMIEDYDIDGELNLDCDWLHGDRDMMQPGLHGYPSIYHGIYWGNTDSNAADYGHVHKNNTVISHAVYNMVRADNKFTDPVPMEKMAELLFRVLGRIWPSCSMEAFSDLLLDEAVKDNQAGKLSDSQLLTIHLAFVRAGLQTLDLSMFPEFDFIRVIAHEMAMFVPQILIDEIGISRAELEEAYYQELTVFWIQLNDPEVQAAFKALYDYVVHGTPLEFE